MTYYFTHSATGAQAVHQRHGAGLPDLRRRPGRRHARFAAVLRFQRLATRQQRAQRKDVLRGHGRGAQPAFRRADQGRRYPRLSRRAVDVERRAKAIAGPAACRPAPASTARPSAWARPRTLSEIYAAEARDPRFSPGVRLSVSVQKEDGSADTQQYVVTLVRHEAVDSLRARRGRRRNGELCTAASSSSPPTGP